ncbi:hypothetical protein ACWGR4_06700 [Embleya sp. NPDC055664]
MGGTEPERNHAPGHPAGGAQPLSRHLCDTDRRGIYTEVTSAGCTLLSTARPTHDRTPREALAEAAEHTEPAPPVGAVKSLGA